MEAGHVTVDPTIRAKPAIFETAVAPAAPWDRLGFQDALRGFALSFSVRNHTGRWWQDRIMAWPLYYGIYVTMAIAAPIFLFLVRFCLPLSKAPEEPRLIPMLWKYTKRGVQLIL